jgi:hypothetical protein
MNRQQFNKYLAGTALPTAVTLERMSEYFKVDQRALFDRPESFRGNLQARQTDFKQAINSLPPDLAGGLMDIVNSSAATGMREGCYAIYFPWLADSKRIVRAVIFVFKAGQFTCFRRYTKLRMVETHSRRYPRGRHEGIIAQREGRLYLIGRNSRGMGDVSLISCGSAPLIGGGMFHGIALVIAPWGEPVASRVTLEYLGGREVFRSSLKSTGLLHQDDPSIAPEIREAMTTPLTSNVPQIPPFGSLLDLAKPPPSS